MNIAQWDWKARVFYDKKLRKAVLDWAYAIGSEEGEIYSRLVDFYSSFSSIAILLELYNSGDYEREELLSIAYERSSDFVYCSPQYFQQVPQEFSELLEAARRGKRVWRDYWDLMVYILGEDFSDLLSDYSEPVISVKQTQCLPRYQSTISSLLANPSLIEKFGEACLKPYDVEIKEGERYGEWWYGPERDLLVLYTKNGFVNNYDFFYTLLHEVYPGHGHFYNTLKNSNFDHGALTLIEGWATFCEWNSILSPYITRIRHKALHLLYCLYHDRPIFDDYRVTQYPGYVESYYLGALWFEKHRKPLSSIKNVGEFFRLW